MSTTTIVQKAFYESMDEINELLTGDKKLLKSPATFITGDSSPLDSLLLLNLIISVEEKLKTHKIPTKSLVEYIATRKTKEVSIQMLTDFILKSEEGNA